jgi:hypothetical protein
MRTAAMPRHCTVRRSWTGHRIGESHPRARLSDHDVTLIRTLHEEHHLGYATLAAKFEAPKSTIRNVCTYRTRGDVET